jgi:PAS domain-containing protein
MPWKRTLSSKLKGKTSHNIMKSRSRDYQGIPGFYRSICDHFPDAVFVESQDGRILECNASALEMFGYSREEMIGLNGSALFPEEVGKTIPAGRRTGPSSRPCIRPR